MKKNLLSSVMILKIFGMAALVLYFIAMIPVSLSAQQNCTITNMQGPIGSGSLNIFAVANQGISTLFNPAGTDDAGDPGCGFDTPFPYTINSVQLNIFAAGGFGLDPSEGVGIFEYTVSVQAVADTVGGCNYPTDALFTSEVQSIAVDTSANQYPQTIDVDISVDEAFFVTVTSVSWTGALNRAPSAVLWNNASVPACRQYVYTNDSVGNSIETDFSEFFDNIGYTNVVVNGVSENETPLELCPFVDDIEGYALGPISPQNANDQWQLWTPNQPGSDGDVTDAQALSGSQSVLGDVDTDLLYLLGNQTTGTWNLIFYLYIPSGNSGYFNIQKTETAGQQFATAVFFNSNGSGTVDAGTVGVANFAYAQDTWIEINIVINLDDDIANLYIDQALVNQWPYSQQATTTTTGLSSIGSIDFYPAGDGSQSNPLMYIDDVSFCTFPNYEPCSAFQLLLDETVQGNNSDATVFDPSLADGSCWSDGPTINGDVWYSFTVPADVDYVVTTDLDTLENQDIQILVFTSSDNSCNGDLTQIGCGDNVDDVNFLTSVDLVGLEAGTVIYILVDGWGGTSGTFEIQVNDGPDAVVDPSVYDMEIYPNPATAIVQIHANENMSNVVVLNSIGQLVERVNASPATNISLDVNSYAPGFYFVQVNVGEVLVTQKLVVQ